jgi:cyanophycin synthetase
MFDHVIIRQEKHLRGRTESEIINLILEGLKEGDASVTHEVVSLEIEAIKHAISLAEEGTYIVALSDVIDNAIDIVQSYLDAEIEETNVLALN